MNGRCAGYDPVEVPRIALCLGEPFTPAFRAADEIIPARLFAVEGMHDRFCLYRSFMHGPIAEIHYFFRMSDGPTLIGSADVSIVCGCCGISVDQRLCHSRERNQACKPAVAHLLKFFVPA